MYKVSSALVLTIALLSRAASAQPDPPPGEPPIAVLLIVPESTGDAGDRLARVVEAHLSGLDVELGVAGLAEFPDDLDQQIEIAATHAERNDTALVFWLTPDASGFHVLVPGSASGPESLGVSADEPGSAMWCDVLAAMVHSMVAPLLPEPPLENTDVPEPSASAEATAGSSISKEEEPEPSAPAEATAGSSISKADDTTRLALLAAAGYTPGLPDSNGPVRHGARLGLGVGIGTFIELNAGVDLMETLKLDAADDGSAELFQLPVRLDLAVAAPMGKFQLSAVVGAVVETRRVRELSYEASTSETTAPQAYFGLSTAIGVRFWIVEWIALWIEVGADFYFKSSNYELDDEPLAELGPLRPRAVFGLAFSLDLIGGGA